MIHLPRLIVDREEIRKALFATESGPIVRSLLQDDFYKETMGNFIHRFYPDVDVTFGFKNRSTHIHLAKEIDKEELRRELDHVKTLRYTPDEIRYLANIRNDGVFLFSDDYLEYLRTFTMPDYNLSIVDEGKQFAFTTSAKWNNSKKWEIMVLQIISALRTESLLRKMSKSEQDAVVEYTAAALEGKMITLKDNPKVTFSDFCTRRAATPLIQRYSVLIALENLRRGQFVGTSNTLFAKELQTMASGTNAHELPMVVAALAETDAELTYAPIKVLEQWWHLYGWGLSIVLPDTFGSDWMFQNIPHTLAAKQKGMRPDSMDLYEHGEKQIRWHERHGVDPRERLMIPSDGLSLESMIKATYHFQDRIKVSSGWGGGFGNDTGLGHPSIVAKAIMANGRPCVKLSDNLAKAMGPEEEKERYVRVFDYHNLRNVVCER